MEFKGKFIKMNEIEQNIKGDTYAIAYSDDGKFYVSIVNNKGEQVDFIDVSNKLFLDDKAKALDGFWEPGISCCFYG